MPSALDQYTNIQKKIADKKAAWQSLVTNKENIDKAVAQFGQEEVNKTLGQVQQGGVGIQNTTTGANIAPPPEPTPGSSLVTPPKTNVSPTQAPIVPPEPTKAPEPIKTETAVQTSTPITPPVGFQYGNQMDSKTWLPTLVKTSEFERQKKLETNKTLYANWKSIFDGVKSGSLIPWSQDFADLQTVNPNAFAEYQALKQNDDRKNAVEVLGSTIIGEAPPTRKNATLDSLIANITGGMDWDIATNYKNAVTNNPEYIQATNKVNALNTQLADVNNNLRQLGEDVRKKYSADTPESLIASAIAREAKPLIDQAQYIQDQVTNAQAEATRIFENNKEVFWLQMQERTDNRNLAFKLYDTINADEIRQEDIQREDERIKKEIALEEYRYQRELADGNMMRAEERKNKLDDLRVQDEYNMKNGLLQLGVDPTGMTPEEMNKQYAKVAWQQAQFERNMQTANLNLDYAKLGAVSGDGTPAPQFEPVMNQDGTMKISQNSVYNLAIWPDWNSVQVQWVEVWGKAPNGRVECWAFVNDLIGTKIFGNQLSDKTKNINSNIPVVGGAFIEDVGQYGHVWFIESINEDWSINIIDSNYSKDTDGRIRRDTIQPGSQRWNQIKWFYDPSTEIPWATPLNKSQKSQLMSLQWKADTRPEIKSWRNTNAVRKWIEQADKIDLNGSDIQGLISNYAKILDPDSVVREWEYAIAQSGASKGKADTIRQQIKTVLYGGSEVLSKEAQKVLVEAMKRRIWAMQSAYDEAVQEELAQAQSVIWTPVSSYQLFWTTEKSSGNEFQTTQTDDDEEINSLRTNKQSWASGTF